MLCVMFTSVFSGTMSLRVCMQDRRQQHMPESGQLLEGLKVAVFNSTECT